MIQARHERAAFALRIWWETGDLEGPPHWRGWVQHAPTGRHLYFQSLEELVEFLETWVGSLRNISQALE